MNSRIEMIDLLEELAPKDPILIQTIIQTLVWDISEDKSEVLEDFMKDYCGEEN